MEVKPGYKQTEVGVIPEEWDVQACSEMCLKIQDGTHFSPSIRGNDYLYVTSKNIGFGVFDVSNADRIDAAQHKAIYKRCDVRHGDLLLTKDGANTGNAALNTLEEESSLLSSVAFLRFDPKRHTAGYFLQQILSNPGQRRIKDAMAGDAITRLTLAKIRKLRFAVAPLPEQRAIAGALSDVDALIGGLDQLIAKKRDLKQAAMQQLLTGQTRLLGFQGEWVVRQLGDVGAFSKGRGIRKDEVVADGLPCVRYGEIYTHHNDYLKAFNSFITPTTAQQSQRMEKGDLLFAGSGETAEEIGKCVAFLGDEEAYAGGDIVIFRPVGQDSKFLGYLMNHSSVASQKACMGQGDAVVHISARNLARLELDLPAHPEQSAIAEVLSDMDAELVALEQRRAKTRALKQGMMQELLTGRTRLV